MNTIALLDAIRTIALNGLGFTKDPYDVERYEKLLELASQSYEEFIGFDEEHIRTLLRKDFAYVTPKVGADAAIFDIEGRVLLIDRTDGTGWCTPCGWLDPNERPADAAIREAFEETGLKVNANQLVGVFTHLAGDKNISHSHIAVVYLCEPIGGQLNQDSDEVLDVKYWRIDEVPKWHGLQEKLVRAAYKMWSAKEQLPAFSD